MPDTKPTTENTSGSPPSETVPATPPTEQKVTKILWATLVLAMVAVVGWKVLEPKKPEFPVLYHGADFALTDENSKAFGSTDLRGKPFICDFVFTTCGSVCPTMSAKMRDVQKQTPANVQLVSFTVNPEFDKPPVLKEYAARFGADESRWHFLTGTPEQMHKAAVEMRVAVQDATPTDPIFHDSHFLLVDGDGNVRGVYASSEPERMQALVRDAKVLASNRGAH